jgi:hypothetical protein
MKFVNLLKQIIVETKNVEELLNTFAYGQKKSEKGKIKKSLMTPDELMVIISNDPTSIIKGLRPENVVNQLYNPDIKNSEDYIDLGLGAVEKTGDYTEWIISQLRKLAVKVDQEVPFKENRDAFEEAYKVARNLFFEDLFKVKQNLIRFHANKKTDNIKKKDINQYVNFKELNSVVESLPLEIALTTKSERKESDVHPGSEIVFETPKWRVIKIERKDKLGKEAACFYGGNMLQNARGETNWCTSSPGLKWFEQYIEVGPLFVMIPKSGNTKFGPKDIGDISGLPSRRYQFHFERKQFMDPNDDQIDLAEYFSPGGEMEDLKEFFKPYFAKTFMSSGMSSTEKSFKLNYPSNDASIYASIYGLDSILEQLPSDLKKFEIKSNTPLNLNIDENFVKKFKDLDSLCLENAVTKLPSNIGELKNIKFFAVTNTKNIDEIPESVGNFIDSGLLLLISFAQSNKNLKIPEKVRNAIESNEVVGYLP